MNFTMETLINALKAIPFFPVYILMVFTGAVGTVLQQITGGLITDKMIEPIINFFVFILGFANELFFV